MHFVDFLAISGLHFLGVNHSLFSEIASSAHNIYAYWFQVFKIAHSFQNKQQHVFESTKINTYPNLYI